MYTSWPAANPTPTRAVPHPNLNFCCRCLMGCGIFIESFHSRIMQESVDGAGSAGLVAYCVTARRDGLSCVSTVVQRKQNQTLTLMFRA